METKDENVDELLKAKEKFLLLFKEVDKEKAEIIYNYISQQLNEMSFRGELDFISQRIAVKKGIRGLFKLVYFDLFDMNVKDRSEYYKNLNKCDILYTAARNLFILLFSRATGKDREIILKQIEAQRPVVVGK